MPSAAQAVSPLVEGVVHRWPWSRGNRFARAVQPAPPGDLVRIGSDYGGREIPDGLLDETSVCYSGGVGLDASFDLGLIERYGCRVHAFDPTPAASAYAREVAEKNERFEFHPLALWSSDGELTLTAPEHRDPQQVENWSSSQGAGNGHSLSAPCRSLESLRRELGHSRIDLLKLDVEGAEYEVLSAALKDGIEIGVICVEFHKTPSIRPMIEMTRTLEGTGFRAVALDGFDVTFSSR
jgi:FkbM family methyltransferase